ncbi:MAG: hypothetical protein J6S08_04150 [Duodenibacillus sp.]|nr:hypothetical protein [Duodenibacillus sp.]
MSATQKSDALIQTLNHNGYVTAQIFSSNEVVMSLDRFIIDFEHISAADQAAITRMIDEWIADFNTRFADMDLRQIVEHRFAFAEKLDKRLDESVDPSIVLKGKPADVTLDQYSSMRVLRQKMAQGIFSAAEDVIKSIKNGAPQELYGCVLMLTEALATRDIAMYPESETTKQKELVAEITKLHLPSQNQANK